MVPRPRSAPKDATIPASAFARCRSARPWWHAWSPITICVSVGRWARRRHGRSPGPEWSGPKVVDNHQRVEAVLAAFAAGGGGGVTDDAEPAHQGGLCVRTLACAPKK